MSLISSPKMATDLVGFSLFFCGVGVKFSSPPDCDALFSRWVCLLRQTDATLNFFKSYPASTTLLLTHNTPTPLLQHHQLVSDALLMSVSLPLRIVLLVRPPPGLSRRAIGLELLFLATFFQKRGNPSRRCKLVRSARKVKSECWRFSRLRRYVIVFRKMSLIRQIRS